MSRFLLLLVAGAALGGLTQEALAIPTGLQHQGRLLDGDGVGLEGDHVLGFSLFEAQTGGAALWSEILEVGFDAGYYSLTLGGSTSLDDSLFSGGPLWLELTVDGETLAPRQTLGSVPTALRAASAESADSVASVGWSDIADVPADLADGDDDSDSLGSLACTNAAIPVWNAAGAQWICGADADTDSLGALACSDEAIPVWSAALGAWVCGADADTQVTSLDWSDITSRPAGLDDGDDDTQVTSLDWSAITSRPAGLDDGDDDTQVTSLDWSAITSRPAGLDDGDDDTQVTSLDWSAITSRPAGLDDGDDDNDTLGSLSCSQGQVAEFDGSSWVCGRGVVAWHAYNSSGASFSSGQTLVYGAVTVNAGGAYDTSTGVATIPGDGVYRLCTYTISYNNSSGNTYMDLYVNGSDVSSQGGRVYAWNRSSSALHLNLGGCVLRDLSAGDTVYWVSEGVNSVYPSGMYSYMNGERL